jgi:hypothetical protein
MTDIKDLSKSLDALVRELRQGFAHKVVNEYFHGTIEVDYDSHDQVQNVIRSLASLGEVARFVDATIEELGSSMRTTGECLEEIAETRELVYLQATGDQLHLVNEQMELVRSTIQGAVTRLSQYRQALLKSQDEEEL